MDTGLIPADAGASPDGDRTPAGSGSVSRSILVIGGSIATLIVIAIVAVLAFPGGPTTYPPGSPEAAFQGYYSAYEVGDLEAAYAYFSAGVKEKMSLADFQRFDSDHGWQRDQDRRIVLDRVDRTGGRAVLRLRIDEFSPGGLGGNRYSHERSIRLIDEGGAWLIDEALIGIESGAYLEPAY